MPTATPLPAADDHAALAFAARGAVWSLGLFGLVRLAWVETHLLLPLTQVQGQIAESVFGTPALPILVTLACSGADALSLCAGAILAYPAPWRVRLRGVAAGIALILALNTIRIGTLGRAVGSSSFDGLHLYVWPGLLTLAVAGYVFGWMRFADRPGPGPTPASGHTSAGPDPGGHTAKLTRRFVWLSAAFLVIFIAAAPWYLGSAVVLAAGAFVARGAAAVLGAIGVHAAATGNLLATERGAFLVTQECIATPLIPVYLAAIIAYATTWPRRALGFAALVPLFIALGIARLLVIALPAAIASSPTFLIHAFSQLLLAAIVVYVAALWRHGPGVTAWRRALTGATAGGLCVYLLGPFYSGALTAAFGAPPADPQGAILLLPAFQVGLYVALCIAGFVVLNWRFFVTGLAGLGLSQAAAFAAMSLLARYAGFTPNVRDVRAWALAGPLLVVAAMVTYERTRR